ncbi:transposase [Chryseobacterium joostei]|uniref:transposase n=1 Tax=Chryseobacterium joostei TaxID=112234 RepID=UPI003D1431FC
MNYKKIHIGSLISQKVTEASIDIGHISSSLGYSIEDIRGMYESESLDVAALLNWSKLLHYDFFRLYSQHLILYAPQQKADLQNLNQKEPVLRRNVYTVEIIEFILEKITSGQMTKLEVMNRYNIPKTTLFKWFYKYGTENNPR